MSGDRYLKAVLTIIALELLWIGVKDSAPAVSAQAQAQPQLTSVVIRGIQLPNGEPGYLPVAVLGSIRQVPPAAAAFIQPLQAEITGRPVRVEAPIPLKVEIDGPVKVETDRPLSVENVQYTPTARPR
jgi:hypothetical protein